MLDSTPVDPYAYQGKRYTYLAAANVTQRRMQVTQSVAVTFASDERCLKTFWDLMRCIWSQAFAWFFLLVWILCMIWSTFSYFDRAHLPHRPVNTDGSSVNSIKCCCCVWHQMTSNFAMSISPKLTKELLWSRGRPPYYVHLLPRSWLHCVLFSYTALTDQKSLAFILLRSVAVTDLY